MSSLLRIRQLYRSLSRNDQKLADFLLHHTEEARHLSSQRVAEMTGVSQSSVVKFAQKLGYKGFTALKLALSEALVNRQDPPSIPVHNQILSDDPIKTVGEKLLAEKVAALRGTLDINSEDKLRQGVEILQRSKRIIIVGIGASGLVARDFSYKLMKIGMAAVAENDMHVLLATVQALGPDDLLFAISFSGTRREINLAAQEALRAGARVMAVTNFAPNELQHYADLTLYTVSEQQAQRSGAISSNIAQQALTDLLFMGLVQQDLEHAPDRIRHSEELVKKLV
ncbi:Transcriptional regulator, RpiR family [Sodalis praecaptivus]|uniref:Transcriptional regulator, RpiR family n=1 Tax=Sodalis praecaptivus TaxID=1239307 RepID=W0HVK0_9GAMM|nr:MurR/RpiR family transcriptional regulator [Sodalis praecaptivus]AHF76178.1 Transcriptional regulator, RpiR family [Sodalis praecaptivus]